MDNWIIVGKFLLLLTFFIFTYICPVALALSAFIRLVLRWHSNWKLLTAALLTALPQAYFAVNGDNRAALNMNFILLTIFAAVLHFVSTRGHRSDKKLLLDIVIFFTVIVLAFQFDS